MGQECEKCGYLSKLIRANGDLCVACSLGWEKSGADAGIASLRALIECIPSEGGGNCWKCLACMRVKNQELQDALLWEGEKVHNFSAALEFYSDENMFRPADGVGFTAPAPVISDKGKKAREALGLQS